MGANVAIGREIVNDFKGDITAKDDDRIKRYDSTENTSDGSNVGGVLTYRAIELMFVFAVSRNLGPVDAVTMAINPAEVTFRFENEDSPFVDSKAVDLQKFGIRNDVIFDVIGVGLGIWFRKITVYDDILRVEDFLQTKDQTSFGRRKFYWIG